MNENEEIMSIGTREDLDRISTRHDLAKYVKILSKLSKLDANGWENTTLPSFLEALAAWIEDMEGFYLNQNRPVPQNPEWKTFAEMLSSAAYYE